VIQDSGNGVGDVDVLSTGATLLALPDSIENAVLRYSDYASGTYYSGVRLGGNRFDN
jgi:hypothetical protein